MIRLLQDVENEMCSPSVAILTAVLLQVKTFVLYSRHYDQEVLPREVKLSFKALATRFFWQQQLCKFALLSSCTVLSMWPTGPLVANVFEN